MEYNIDATCYIKWITYERLFTIFLNVREHPPTRDKRTTADIAYQDDFRTSCQAPEAVACLVGIGPGAVQGGYHSAPQNASWIFRTARACSC